MVRLELATNLAMRATLCFLLGALAGCAVPGDGVSTVQQRQWSNPPNVLLILLDDFGISNSSAYGGAYSTPRIDAIADAGVRFTHGFSQPLCGVSRAALLSGLYPERTRVIDHNHLNKYATTLYTMPKAFRDAGYATHLAGKWQLGPSALDTVAEGDDYGWDTWLAWNTGSPFYYGATHNRNGVNETYAASEFGPDFLQDFVTGTIDAAIGPWFMYYATPLVHDMNSPMYVAPPGSSATTQADKYRDLISYVDNQIGALMDFLVFLGIDDETLVLVIGDNGPHCNAIVTKTINGVPINGCKSGLTSGLLEGGVRVPWIAYWPTVIGAAVSDRLVDLTDVWPTLAEVAGLPMNQTYDGHSFARELAGVYVAPRPWTYVQVLGYPSCYARGRTVKMTCGGTCTDMSNAPFSETSTSGAACDELGADLLELVTDMGAVP